LNLPKRNGWDTFESLTRQNPRLPVIIITARPNQLFPALAAGVGALMEKPLDFPKLLQTIRNLLAEPAEARLARLVGKPGEFHYMPAPPSTDQGAGVRLARDA
jgi:DNA-binding response OmpR family regulator